MLEIIWIAFPSVRMSIQHLRLQPNLTQDFPQSHFMSSSSPAFLPKLSISSSLLRNELILQHARPCVPPHYHYGCSGYQSRRFLNRNSCAGTKSPTRQRAPKQSSTSRHSTTDDESTTDNQSSNPTKRRALKQSTTTSHSNIRNQPTAPDQSNTPKQSSNAKQSTTPNQTRNCLPKPRWRQRNRSIMLGYTGYVELY